MDRNTKAPKVHRKPSTIKTHDMIGLLGDEYNLKILTATQDYFMSIDKMIDQLDIPMISCYRRVRELERYNLLASRFVISDSRKKKRAYLSNLRSYHIQYNNGKIRTEVRYNDKEEPEYFDITSNLVYIG
jgi:hypothetical protein